MELRVAQGYYQLVKQVGGLPLKDEACMEVEVGSSVTKYKEVTYMEMVANMYIIN